MNIPFLNFAPMHSAIRTEMLATFGRVYDSYWYILGNELLQFEKAYSAFNHTSYTIGVSNGLDALTLILKALDVGPGDEVIVPSNTYIASLLAVSIVGAKPVLVEPNPLTYNLDPTRIEPAITSHTKVIMPVHLYGQACKMDSIVKIADDSKIWIVEDNAQSHGSTYNGKLTGSWGIAGGTSFYPGKNLGALGDGGAITTNNEEIANKLFSLRNYGSKIKYKNEILGHNMRLDELQAAFLSIKLNYLTEWTSQRQKISEYYSKTLNGVGDLILPSIEPAATHVYHLYVIRTKKRDDLQKFLGDKGIGTLIHYPIPPHLQKAYSHLDYKKGDFPIAEEIADTCLSLPMWPGLTQEQIEGITYEINCFFNQ
jgi:dTDP-4-amino-4,6-dideoxygalactose transaminase